MRPEYPATSLVVGRIFFFVAERYGDQKVLRHASFTYTREVAYDRLSRPRSLALPSL